MIKILEAKKKIKLVIKKIIVNNEIKNRLGNLGIIEEKEVVVIANNFGDLILDVRGSRLAIGKDLANNICVEEIL